MADSSETEGNNSHFNLGFEFLIVNIDGILPVVLGPASQQAVGHLNVQQVVQHLDLGLYQHKRHLSLYTRVDHVQYMQHVQLEDTRSNLHGE